VRACGKRGLSISSRRVTDPDGAHDSFATCPLRRASRITIRYLSCATRRNMRTQPARQQYRRPYYVSTRISASERWIFAPPKIA